MVCLYIKYISKIYLDGIWSLFDNLKYIKFRTYYMEFLSSMENNMIILYRKFDIINKYFEVYVQFPFLSHIQYNDHHLTI